MALHPWLRRLVVILVLGLAWLPLTSTDAHAASGLSITGKARYVVDPAGGSVAVAQTVTITNRKPDSGRTYYLWDQWGFLIPTSAEEVSVTSGGGKLSFTTKASQNLGTKQLIASFSGIRYGQSKTLELTYRLRQAQFRSDDSARVGKGFASFPVLLDGDPGQLTVEIVAPSSMTFSASETTFTESADGGTTTRTSTTPTEGDFFGASVALSEPDVGEHRKVEVNGRTVDVIAFPGDTTWADFVTTNLSTTVAALEKTTGLPAPANVLEIREDISLATQGYDGTFNRAEAEIRLSESLDLTTFCHELAHSWINRSVAGERWLAEGLAEDLAVRTVRQLGGTPTERLVARTDAHAFALETWQESETAAEAENYAYPASAQVFAQVLGKLDATDYTRVVKAIASKKVPLGNAVYSSPPLTWEALLDVLDTVDAAAQPDASGRTPAANVVSTWVISDPASVDWKARLDARARFLRLDDADGSWTPPTVLQSAMASWDFATAQGLMATIEPLASSAKAVQDAAQQAGRPVPDKIRAAYEHASSADSLAAVRPKLDATRTTLSTLAEVDRAAGSVSLPTSRVARQLIGLDADVKAAENGLESDAVDSAVAAAKAARDKAQHLFAVSLALLIAPLVGLAAVALMVPRWLRARRRKASMLADRPQPAAGEIPLAATPSEAGHHASVAVDERPLTATASEAGPPASVALDERALEGEPLPGPDSSASPSAETIHDAVAPSEAIAQQGQ